MKILVDNNLPVWWAAQFRKDSQEAVHVLECGLADASDEDIRRKLVNDPIVLVSRDSDFWQECPLKWSLIWIRVHNPRIADLKSWLYDSVLCVARQMEPKSRCMVTEDEIIHFR